MISFADLDDDFAAAGEVEITPELFAALPAKWLSNGFYTLTFPDDSHRTYRVRLEKSGLFAGKRTLSLLIGPDNTNDYESHGVVAEDEFKLFKRFARGKSAEHAFLLWHLAKGDELDGYELLVSKRCRYCNRPLSVPDSITDELGPVCRKRVGM